MFSSLEIMEGSDYHLNHIARSGTGRLYIAAEAGTIYRSDDDGQTWISLPSPYHGSFFGTLPLENDSLPSKKARMTFSLARRMAVRLGRNGRLAGEMI